METNRDTLGRITPAGQITEVPLPVPAGNAFFAFGPDGNIWLGLQTDIAEITPQGALLHDYAIPSASPPGIPDTGLIVTMGPDGNIWYTEPYTNNLIGRLTPNGQITEFPIPGWVHGEGAANIITGPDDNLWFDAVGHNAIGRVHLDGTMDIFSLPPAPIPQDAPRGLTAGPDGNLWMAVAAQTPGGVDQILRVNTAGQLTGQFNVPTPNAFAYGMTVGSDGALWFTEHTANQIGRITTDGNITEMPITTGNHIWGGITSGPDGNIWFSEYSDNHIGEVVLNAPPANVTPTLAASTINEGQSATLGGTFTDPNTLDSHTVVVAWGDGSANTSLSLGSGVYSFSGVSHTYQDNLPNNAPYTITVTVTDNHGASASGSTSITVRNVAPTVGAITAAVAPVPVNTAVSASASFTDPGILDTHTAVWNWGDGSTSPGTVTETNGSGTVSGSHTYTLDGVYTVTLMVTDKDGASGLSTFRYVVVYNPSAGFTTGGGWLNSPAGAYAANTSLTGQANFGLNAKYQSGSTVPTGNTEFQFPAANLNFHAISYDWLVITTNQAQYQGSGTINGAGNYGFLVTAQDNGGTTPDLFRMKIWDKSNNNAVVYDTQPGAATTAAPTTALGGGRIRVHTNAQLVAGGENASGGNVAPLTPDELQPVVQEAIARWEGAGINAAQLSALSQVAVGIADLPGPWLGMAFPGAIWIDQNAAGYGWYIDATPASDGGFPATPGSPAYGKVDLLTVVAHELGHELGFDDTADNSLMGVFLPTGTRRLPIAGPSAAPGEEGATPTAIRRELLVPFAALLLNPNAGTAEPSTVTAADEIAGTVPQQSQALAPATAAPANSYAQSAVVLDALFAQAQDNYGPLGDPFALTFQVN
jgi:streptogramin lyase